MIRIAIVEDEKKDMDHLVQFLDKYQKDNNVEFLITTYLDSAVFTNSFNNNFDLVFLDIEMPKINGMDTASEIRKKDQYVTIIFVTNVAQYAIKGYEVNAHYFLLKPLRYDDFKGKLERTISFIEKTKEKNLFVVNTQREKRIIETNDITHIIVLNHDLYIYTKDEEILSTGSLRKIESKLEKYGFFRVNNYCVVNLAYISSYKKNSIFIGNKDFPVSRSRKKELLEKIVNYNKW